MRRPHVLIALLAAGALTLSGCALVGLPLVEGCYERVPATAPPRGSAGTRILLMGDFGTGETGANQDVAAAMRLYLGDSTVPVERVFELGDNFYMRGLIGKGVKCSHADKAPDGAITAQIREVLGPFAFLRDKHIPITAIPGNHDHWCDPRGLTNQADIDRWLPADEQWGKLWQLEQDLPRSLELAGGQLQLVLLDSERMIHDSDYREQSIGKLETLLRDGRGRYRWQLIAAHHPLGTNGTHDGAWSEGIRRPISFILFPLHLLAALRVPGVELLNEDAYSFRYVQYRRDIEAAIARSGANVPLFLAGHDHQLQLLKASQAGQPRVLISGSGAYCSNVRKGPEAEFAAAKNGFASITVNADSLDVEFVGTTGCDEHEPCAAPTKTAWYPLFETRVQR